MIILLAVFVWPLGSSAAPPEQGDHLTVSGIITDAQGKGVKEAEIELLVNGKPVKPLGREEHLETGVKGSFVGRYLLPPGALPDAKVQVRAVKPSWQAGESGVLKVLDAGPDPGGNRLFQAQADLTLKRKITLAFWIATVVLWWSLALGACLGGNGTMIGASANVVTVGLAEKAGYHLSFLGYMRACWWPMMITVTLSMVYLLMAY
jgi:hypothetical protein